MSFKPNMDITGRGVVAVWGAVICLIVIAAFLLAGCAPIDAGACPPLKQWTKEQQEQLYNELDQLPSNYITIDVVADYMTLRDQVRACQ